MLRPVLLLLAAVLVLPLGAPQQDGAAPRDLALQQELIDCINQKYTGKPTTYNNSVLRDQPAG